MLRNLLIVSFVVVCISPVFWACQKEDLGNIDSIFSDTTQAVPVAKMVAKINDTSWSAVSTDAIFSNGQINLTGLSSDGQKIVLNVYSSTEGDYLLRLGATSSGKYYPDSVTTLAYSSNIENTTGGIINIATLDTVNEVMSGFFNFISARSATSKVYKTVTQGVFNNISYTNTNVTFPFSVKKNGKLWVPATKVASVSGSTLTIRASNLSTDTTVILTMPANIMASGTPIILAATGSYTASVQEKTYSLTLDTSSVIAKKYKILPRLTILSNDGTYIKGTFSFVADYQKPKAQIVTTFNGGSFYLKYK